MGAPIKAESPWHMVTRPNDDVSFSIPNSSAIMIDRKDTNTAENRKRNWHLEKRRLEIRQVSSGAINWLALPGLEIPVSSLLAKWWTYELISYIFRKHGNYLRSSMYISTPFAVETSEDQFSEHTWGKSRFSAFVLSAVLLLDSGLHTHKICLVKMTEIILKFSRPQVEMSYKTPWKTNIAHPKLWNRSFLRAENSAKLMEMHSSRHLYTSGQMYVGHQLN